MKINTWFQLSLTVLLLFMLTASTHAFSKASSVDSSNWQSDSYSPQLYLLPYFSFGELVVEDSKTVLSADCSITTFPFIESFNSNSTTKNCWTILDVDNDGAYSNWLKGMENVWSSVKTEYFEPDGAMRFVGGWANHDDWLISPTFTLNGGNYALTYYYKVDDIVINKFEVLLSTSGISPADFKNTLVAKAFYKNKEYVKKTVNISGYTGDINIAWHVTTQDETDIYLDLVSLVEVDCIAPSDDVLISNIKKNEATFKWNDSNNKQWETYVKEFDGITGDPVGSGTLRNSNSATITSTNGTSTVPAAPLKPNTEYEFYVRSSCNGGKNSPWIGPIKFTTLCDEMTIPFWEGFNDEKSLSPSPTIDCWRIVDNNGDSTGYANLWRAFGSGAFEGGGAMNINGIDTTNDDWLISPTFNLDATKSYRLKYHYKTNTSDDNEFEVLLSKNGIDISNFKQTVLPKKIYKNGGYVQEITFIQNVGGLVNLAWHVTSDGNTNVFLDNVFLEEVVGCPEPLKLGAKDEGKTKATIYWTDDFNKGKWEYSVRKTGSGAPSGIGVSTDLKEAVVTVDGLGKNLLPNTEYEFYVRADCGDGSFSVWSGPFKFRTLCDVIDLPLWEGFNYNSNTIYCWEFLDENKDGTTAGGKWKTQVSNAFEGGTCMYFNVNDYSNIIQTNDYLISPTFVFKPNTMYRLRYHYRTDAFANFSNFEVVASNKGVNAADFDFTIIADSTYKTAVYQEKRVFIEGLSGDVNIAWHTKGTGSKVIYIDNVFVEEVLTCPEPLNGLVKDIETHKATIEWSDEFGATDWEYYVQEEGLGTPKSKGTATTSKVNVVSKLQSGTALNSNSDYEFYVRTICADGGYSIWLGPYLFTTECDLYDIPFWEGFNKDSNVVRCWVVKDENKDASTYNGIWKLDDFKPFEGNQMMHFVGLSNNDDWLITPTFNLDGGKYVLKYHYKTESKENTEFEVLLSNGGLDVSKFTKEVVAKKVYKNDNFIEEVVYIDGVVGDVNIGWHVTGKGRNVMNLDNISLRKVENCEQPYHVEIVGQTTTSLDVEWQQDGGSTSWEVIVVDYGKDETSTPIKKETVTGSSKVTISGLPAARAVSVFVRVLCGDGKTYSDWSSPANGGLSISNNDCSNALNIPVNSGTDCVKTLPASNIGATFSNAIESPCFRSNEELDRDMWFEFTATSVNHLFSIQNIKMLNDDTFQSMSMAVYSQNCAVISMPSTQPFLCRSLQDDFSFRQLLPDLVPGQKYYVRLEMPKDVVLFEICISSTDAEYLIVDEDKYTAEELVKDILIQSQCDVVSNVRYQAGDGTGTINTLAYFNRGNSDFPFEEGLVLSTNATGQIKGPYKGFGEFKERIPFWDGDAELNRVIDDLGGSRFGKNKAIAVLEFDFIPINDSIKFEYLFASDSYHKKCNGSCREAGALFAAWMTDLETDEGRNLALVSGTNDAISSSTVRNIKKSGITGCGSFNPEFYDKHYDNYQDNPLEAAINYAGLLKPMSSDFVAVTPGKKYRIKLAIADFCNFLEDASSVFFNVGSFNLGRVDLGADMLVETENALCHDETRIIKTGIKATEYLKVDFEWSKDGVVIPGENGSELEISDSGTYDVRVSYPELKCETYGSVKAEVYPLISTVVPQPKAIFICKNSLENVDVDLSSVELAMFANAGSDNYTTSYHATLDDAKLNVNPMDTDFVVEVFGATYQFFIRVVDVKTGCTEVFSMYLRPQVGELPVERESVSVCASYVFPALEVNQHYYTESGAKGIEYKAGDVLDIPGRHLIYVLQRNGEDGCYEESSFVVSVTEGVVADVFEDLVLRCSVHDLKPLSKNNKYFTEPGGKGDELVVGSYIIKDQVIYIYASSEDGLCVDESSYSVSYEECPIQKGISPNGDGLNDSFDLSNHGVEDLKIFNRYGSEVYSYGFGYTNQWMGQNKNGKLLPDGTYYYVVISRGVTRTGWIQINK